MCEIYNMERRLIIPVNIQQTNLLQAVASSKLLYETIYRLKRFGPVAESGAAGANVKFEQGKSDKWYIEEQRNAGDRMEAGIIHELVEGTDHGLIASALKILDWAFERQGKDSGFPGTSDSFHSMEIFVESTAKGLLMLKESGNPDYTGILDCYIPKLHRAARWLMLPEVSKPGRLKNQPFTHRRYIIAAALGQTAELANDREMAGEALNYAMEGLSLMTPDGINPELGGMDSNYQDAGVMNASRYYFVCKDGEVRLQLAEMMSRALKCLSKKIDSNGKVDVTGDTRVGPGHINRDGSPKKFNVKEGIFTFTMGYFITGENGFVKVAERLARGNGWLEVV